MRIVMVTPHYHPYIGGVEEVVSNQSRSLINNGHAVTVHTFNYGRLPHEEFLDGVLVRRHTPILPEPFSLPPESLVRGILTERADVFHLHNLHTSLPLLVPLMRRRARRIVLQPHYHGSGQTGTRNLFFHGYRLLLQSVIPRIHAVLVNTPFEGEMFARDFPCTKYMALLPEALGSDFGTVEWSPEQAPRRILYVGPLRKYKNVDKLLQAFADLRQCEHLKLILVGDGNEKGVLLKLAKSLGIHDQVEWKSNLPREALIKEYGSASVFVSLSSLESFGLGVRQAVVAGIPTVALRTGALSDLDDYVFWVGSTVPSQVAAVIRRALEEGAVSKRAPLCLDWDEYTKSLLKVYAREMSVRPLNVWMSHHNESRLR